MAQEENLLAFLHLYEGLEKKDPAGEAFTKEFQTIKSISFAWKNQGLYPAESGSVPTNRKKNRFKDILPFEHTRVVLHAIEGVEYSDYINANYIGGASGQVEYIAAQGPLPHTVNDFWRMLWYHTIEIVVMVCREVEMGKLKCERYWPELGETRDYGPISVELIKEEHLTEDVTVRDLKARCEGEEQFIRQYHYQTWPDHDKPLTSDPLVYMLGIIKSYQQRKETPIVVHCSAGCGRTGTVIATDYIRSMIASKSVPDGGLDIYKVVESMRTQRPSMVQTKNQYHFVYIASSDLCKNALNANLVLEKPTAPKPKLEKLPAPTPTGPIDYENFTLPDSMYENRESILASELEVKPPPSRDASVNSLDLKRAPVALPRRQNESPKPPAPPKPVRPDFADDPPLDTSTNSQSSFRTANRSISETLNEILGDIDEPDFGPPVQTIRSIPDYEEMDALDRPLTPSLPTRTEESRELMNYTGLQDSLLLSPSEPPTVDHMYSEAGGDQVYSEPLPPPPSKMSTPTKAPLPKIAAADTDGITLSPPSSLASNKFKTLPELSSPSNSSSSIGVGGTSSVKQTTTKSGGLLSSMFKKEPKAKKKILTAGDISTPVGNVSKLQTSVVEGHPPILSPGPAQPIANLPSPSTVAPNQLGSVKPRTTNSAAGSSNAKYAFPGELGFGVRLERPNGPRKEPEKWSRWDWASIIPTYKPNL